LLKKFFWVFFSLFLLYGLMMFVYLFQANQELSQAYVNSPADPATFMTSEQLYKATIYSRIQDLLFFIGIPWEWVIYLLLIVFGFSTAFYAIAKKISGRSFFAQTFIYVFFISAFTAFMQFPLQYYSYQVSREYGISIQAFTPWLVDKGKGFLVDFLLTAPMIWLLYTIIRKYPKKWWLLFWVISIPLTVLLFFMQPVIIDPIFHDFQSLQDQELKQEILALANKADIPAEQVYQVNMSEKTTAMNAYVTGIGKNARIVLWDTTLNKMDKEEILFIMAHEMGHYVYHHIYWMLIGTLITSFILLYFLYKLLNGLIQRFGYDWGIEKVGQLNSLPVILLIVSVLTFVVSPIENTISRQAERAADAYGVRMTNNKQAAISSFQKLSLNSLSEPNPPDLVKIFRYAHPTMVERIYTLSRDGED